MYTTKETSHSLLRRKSLAEISPVPTVTVLYKIIIIRLREEFNQLYFLIKIYH